VAQILHGFDSESAVLAVEKGPMKSGGGENPGHFGRSDLPESTAELNVARFKSLLY
jgi:hypothetical protein